MLLKEYRRLLTTFDNFEKTDLLIHPQDSQNNNLVFTLDLGVMFFVTKVFTYF